MSFAKIPFALLGCLLAAGCSSEDESVLPGASPEPKTPVTCGNSSLDPGEVCDGPLLGGQSCESVAGTTGTLSCNSTCLQLDLSGCGAPTTCGNDALDEGETCDGIDVGGASCESLTGQPGILRCSANCLQYDTAACGSEPSCGNGVVEQGETCDGAELAGKTCADFGFDAGTLACRSDCSGHDDTGCVTYGTHFEDGARWEIPNTGGDAVAGFWNLNASSFEVGNENWTVIDINGDGRPDLVSPNRVIDIGGTETKRPHGFPSDSHWRVYLNNGSGFDEGSRWEIPDVGGDGDAGFWDLNASSFEVGNENWTAIDINGDGRPDLVSPNRVIDVGGTESKRPHGFPSDSHWRVYLNNGSGFDEGARWEIPDAGGDGDAGFWDLSANNFEVGNENWTVIDINGDGRPDLVSPNQVLDVGGTETKRPHGFPSDSHWRVYLNSGSGFKEGARWEIPDAGGDADAGFWDLSANNFEVGNENWSALDINGDGLPDLVSPNRVLDVGGTATKRPHGFPDDSHWRLYVNNGSGFEEASRWELPSSGGDAEAGFWDVAAENFEIGNENWSTLDLNGDGLPDLVSPNHVQDIDGSATKRPHGFPSESHWRIYLNNGSGFDEATRWELPLSGGDAEAGFWNLDASNFEIGNENWSALDIDGDGRLDLVSPNRVLDIAGTATKRPHGFPDDPHWRVYFNR